MYEASRVTGRSVKVLYRLAEEGRIKVTRVPRPRGRGNPTVVFDDDDVRRYAEELREYRVLKGEATQ